MFYLMSGQEILKELIEDNKDYKIASCLLLWEASNILSQRLNLPWREKDGKCIYTKATIFQEERRLAKLSFFISNYSDTDATEPLNFTEGKDVIKSIHQLSVCFHLLYSIYAVEAIHSGKGEFIFSSRQIEQLFNFDNVKHKSRAEKLEYIKQLAFTPAKILVTIQWPSLGFNNSIKQEEKRLWHVSIINEDPKKRHFDIKIKPGIWSFYFLREDNVDGFYNETILINKKVFSEIAEASKRHHAACNLLTWLIYKSQIGYVDLTPVEKLMKIAFGSKKLGLASRIPTERYNLLNSWGRILEKVRRCEMKIGFDYEKYFKFKSNLKQLSEQLKVTESESVIKDFISRLKKYPVKDHPFMIKDYDENSNNIMFTYRNKEAFSELKKSVLVIRSQFKNNKKMKFNRKKLLQSYFKKLIPRDET
jgi:hypothetical protein